MSEYGSYFDTNKIKENIQNKHFQSLVDFDQSYDYNNDNDDYDDDNNEEFNYNEDKKDGLEELIRVIIIIFIIKSRLNLIISLEKYMQILKLNMGWLLNLGN
jgi:hypothetical protein